MTTCVCGQEIVAYYTDGENPSMWLHTSYGQPECLSSQIASPRDGEELPTVACICGEIFDGSEKDYLLKAHEQNDCQVIQNLTAKE